MSGRKIIVAMTVGALWMSAALLAIAASRCRWAVAAAFRPALCPPKGGLYGGRLKPAATRLALAGLMRMMLLWASCGGGGGSMNFGSNGTPAGTYTLTITGTYSSPTGATPGTLANSTTVTLKVN